MPGNSITKNHAPVNAPPVIIPRIKSIQNILISLPKPEKSPYFEIAEKFNINIEFMPFVQLAGLNAKEFRKSKINIPDYDSFVFTSRHAVTDFFEICKEMRIKLSEETKYFCVSESIALYIQKYIPTLKRRKVFYDKDGHIKGFKELLKKHRNTSKFLVLAGEGDQAGELYAYMKDQHMTFEHAPVNKTITTDLSQINFSKYDMLVFFSTASVKALAETKPDLNLYAPIIAAYGNTTVKMLEEQTWIPQLQAPNPEYPSLSMLIEKYLEINNPKI